MNRLINIFYLLVAVSAGLQAQPANRTAASSSVLSAGKWFKIAVTADAIYRIDYETIKSLGLDYPSNPELFSANYGQLSYYNDLTAPDDLQETAIYVNSGSDGIFNEGDYLLFYGRGTHRWIYNKQEGDFDFLRHNYSDTAWYFLTSGKTPGKRITVAGEPSSQVNFHSNTSDALFNYESESENLIHSGREWYQPVSSSKEISIDPGFRDLVLTEPVRFEVRALARASGSTTFVLAEQGNAIGTINLNGVNLSSSTGTYAEISTTSGSAMPQSSGPVYSLQFGNNGETSAKAWLDYARFHARRQNIYAGGIDFFTDARSCTPGSVTEYKIKTSVESVSVWDVTDPCNVVIIQYNKSGDNLVFRSATDSLRTFALFTVTSAKKISVPSEPVQNQDLHASEDAGMIIVSHPLFLPYATRLARMHATESGLKSIVVTPVQIYNEFSGGVPDIAAIRNFVRMKYLRQKGTGTPLKYLLLFGDGSYENKTPPPKNPCFIPTYQSVNSNIFISSFTSDDFFGLLDDGEGEDTGTEDIGIGRIPVSDTAAASIIVSKISGYLSRGNTGDWKNLVCLTADDEDSNTHMTDAEGLATLVADSVPWINVDKIYLDAYHQVTSETGQFYPDVTSAINDRINSGALIFNYIGHGNESSLAHERVVTMETIEQWKNRSRLPLFVTATCEFSRFDDVTRDNLTGIMTGKNSAGEKILLSGQGGGIALMSTTRLVYAAPNYTLNRNILDAAFDRDQDGRALCFGDIIRIAKNMPGGGSNKRNFLLLGDPAVRLAYPWYGSVVTDSVTDALTGEPCDTLKALSMVTVTGHIEDLKGNIVNDFNGVVLPVVYGKPAEKITLANDGGPKLEFKESDNVLFSGRTTAGNGRFNFTFMVPREIDYNFGPGKVSYYAFDEKSDMEGSYDRIIIGGFSNSAVADTSGPLISLFINDTLFRDGGITDKNPVLFSIIEDKGGINTTGSGIGHDIVYWIDGDRENYHILNNYFINDQGIYSRGTVSYMLQDLSEGYHTITLKAWDNFNNSSQKTLSFTVISGEKFVLSKPVNYPNPFNNITNITVEHNRPGEMLGVTIEIFSLTGDLLRVLKTTCISSGYKLPPVVWDRNDSNGHRMASGIYPYRILITTAVNETATVSGRMIIL